MRPRAAHDDPPTCRLCGQPIRDGEPRYREAEGDVHAECREKVPRPRATDISRLPPAS